MGDGIRTPIRLVGLLLICWAALGEVHPGLTGVHLAVWVLLLAVAPAWVVWSFDVIPGRRATAVVLAWMGVVGGALAVLAPIALTFVGAAAFMASLEFDLPLAVALAVAGPAALALATAFHHRSWSLVVGGLTTALVGLVLGVSRRQTIERAEQAAQVAVERQRAELEHERMQVLAERNRLAREIHDVLAHTLGALSVQLEALAALHDAGPDRAPDMRAGLIRTKALATEGLEEARRAVMALRDDSVPLVEQLDALCRRGDADIAVSGEVRPLTSETVLALYRVAQESMTNAAKHAPGADVMVRLAFDIGQITLEVANGAGRVVSHPLAVTGAGYGLQGISERVKLLGGSIDAGPCGPGWRVSVRVPA